MACFSGTRLDTAALRDLTRRVLRAGPEVLLVTMGPRRFDLDFGRGDRQR